MQGWKKVGGKIVFFSFGNRWEIQNKQKEILFDAMQTQEIE